MSSVSSGSFISLKGQAPGGGHVQVVRAGDSKARTTTEHLFLIKPCSRQCSVQHMDTDVEKALQECSFITLFLIKTGGWAGEMTQ